MPNLGMSDSGDLKIGSLLYDISIEGATGKDVDATLKRRVTKLAFQVLTMAETQMDLSVNEPKKIHTKGNTARLFAKGMPNNVPYTTNLSLAQDLKDLTIVISRRNPRSTPKPAPPPKPTKPAKPPKPQVKADKKSSSSSRRLGYAEIVQMAKKPPTGIGASLKASLKRIVNKQQLTSDEIQKAIEGMRASGLKHSMHFVNPAFFNQCRQYMKDGRSDNIARDCSRELSRTLSRGNEDSNAAVKPPRKVIIPFNTAEAGAGEHWVLAEVDLKAKKVVVYDSEPSSRDSIREQALSSRLKQTFIQMGDAYRQAANVHHDVGPSSWTVEVPKEVPNQKGGTSCGYHVVANMRARLNDQPLPDQAAAVESAQRFLLADCYGPQLDRLP